MTAHLDKRSDNMIKGVDIIIEQNKGTALASAFQLIISM
jgi:hypothetical protein